MTMRGARPGGTATASPPPAAVPGNDWTLLDALAASDAEGTSVSVVVEQGEPEAVALTLAALAAQRDPGPPIDVIEPGDDREPAGEVVVFLGAGTAGDPGLLAAHARWHSAAADAVSVGPVAAVDGGGIDVAEVERAAGDGRLATLLDPRRAGDRDDPFGLAFDLTAKLTETADGLFLAAALTGPLAVRRDTYLAAGGAAPADLPAALRRLDLAYRLACSGAVFAPEASVPAWTVGGREQAVLARAIAAAAAERRTLELDHPEAAALVPLEPFRAAASARRLRRPAVVVNVDAGGEPASEVAATIAPVLGGRHGDLELRIQVADSHPERDEIAGLVAGDPRATIAPASTEGPCQSPYQVVLPAVALPDPRTIADLHRLLTTERAGALHVTVPGAPPDETMIEAHSTAALLRARRVAAASGEDVDETVGRLFGERWVSGIEVSVRRHGVEEPHVTEHGPLAAATDPEHERTQHLRFRDRADDLEARAVEQERMIVAERLRARRERLRAERLERALRDIGEARPRG